MNVPEVASLDEPLFVTLMPDGYSRNDTYMGLTEAIAWIASRDKRISDATYWWLHESGDSGPPSLCFGDLQAALGCAAANGAEVNLLRSLEAGQIEALGRRGGASSYSKMDPSDWIDVRISFERGPDSVLPKDTQVERFSDEPAWMHIKLGRNDVFELWPAEGGRTDPAPVKAAPPVTHATEIELREWVAAQVAAGETQTYCGKNFRKAVPGKWVKQNRDFVRDAYNEEYLELYGVDPRPGP